MSTFSELARNFISSVFIHLAPRAANVLLFIIISRHAGPNQAGIFALATTYLIITTVLTKGMDDLIVRQVSRDPQQALSYLIQFSGVRLGLSVLLYAGVAMLSTHVIGYPTSTLQPIQVITLSLFPDSLALVAQAVLQGLRKFGLIAWVMSGITAFKVIVGSFALYSGSGLMGVCSWWLAGSVISFVIMGFAALKVMGLGSIRGWKCQSGLGQHWGELRTFLLITVLTTSESQTDIVLLSILRNETEVGWYNAATTIAFSLAMISQAFRMAIYPLMTQYALHSPEKLVRLRDESLRILGTLAFPMAAGILILAPTIVTLIYKQSFTPAIRALQILIPTLIFLFLNVPSARTLLVYDRQNQMVIFLALSTAVNVGLNLLVDARWGAAGAAVARLISTGLSFFLTQFYVERFLVKTRYVRMLKPAVFATLVMSLVVMLLRGAMILIPIISGVTVYALTLWLMGGIRPEDIARLKSLAFPQKS